MELKKSSRFTTIFLISLLTLFQSTILACGWFEYAEDVRLSLFKAKMGNLSMFRPFEYSANLYNSTDPDPEGFDRNANCLEWQNKLGKDAQLNDIYFFLYKASPEIVENGFVNNNLGEVFEGNSFVTQILLAKNNEALKYLRIAKKLEALKSEEENRFETWDNIDNKDYAIAKLKVRDEIQVVLTKINDDFLKQRYAFLFLRTLVEASEFKKADLVYDCYFIPHPNNSIISKWALLFKAIATKGLGRREEANYLFSLAFDNCEEKKWISFRYFNDSIGILNKTISMAKNDHQKAVILSLACLKNPGPELNRLKNIEALEPNSPFFSFLLSREINKIEDWIFTPKYTHYGPSCQLKGRGWDTDFNQAKAANFKKDVQYAQDLRVFLTSCFKKSNGQFKNFLAVAISHLYFIEGNSELGRTYLGQLSIPIQTSIQVQRDLELCLLDIKTKDIQKNEVKQSIVNYVLDLEKTAKITPAYYKDLYSLNRVLSLAYSEIGDQATAGLLFLKAEQFKYCDGLNHRSPDTTSFDYFKIGYFDRYATLQNMDTLITLIQKHNRSTFENYICKYTTIDINYYYDLKGTIAFRLDNLPEAENAFKKVPADFWSQKYNYNKQLNEDPFKPKELKYHYKRSFNFQFNKATFIAELTKLKTERLSLKNSDSLIKLANAYFNCSFWGNSWAMTSYYISGLYTNHQKDDYNDMLLGYSESNSKLIGLKNFNECALARKYYLLALQNAQNDEQRAMASLMLHVCDFKVYLGNSCHGNWEKAKKYKGSKFLIDFCSKYKNTTTYKNYNCPDLKEFL